MDDFCALSGMPLYNYDDDEHDCGGLFVICNWCDRKVCYNHSVTIEAHSIIVRHESIRCGECIAQNKLVDVRGNHISARDQIMSCIIERCIQMYPSMTKGARK
tara:strand:- start:44738 stop:45046 length:309 start_codon:yes stop_codon:yes gene_type:complete